MKITPKFKIGDIVCVTQMHEDRGKQKRVVYVRQVDAMHVTQNLDGVVVWYGLKGFQDYEEEKNLSMYIGKFDL